MIKYLVLTWFRAESFANWRDVPRCHCSLTLHLLSLRFTLVLFICGIILRRRLAARVFCWRDVQFHVQRYRTDYRTLCLQRRGGGGGRRRELGVSKDSCGGRRILLLASSFPWSLLLLLKLLFLEAALLLTELGSAVFEPNLMEERITGRVRGRAGRKKQWISTVHSLKDWFHWASYDWGAWKTPKSIVCKQIIKNLNQF